MPPTRRIAFAAVVALCAGLTLVVVLQGFSIDPTVKAIEWVAVIATVAAVVFGGAITIGLRLADWREPESEEDFEQVVLRAERLAREGVAADPDETEFLDLDPYDDDDFEELVRDALDDLPDLLRNLVENHNVAVVISDGGRRRRAYGLYHGDGATRDEVPDRIVIYRDTLRRDFGHDPDLLRAAGDDHRAPRARPPHRLRRARRARPRALVRSLSACGPRGACRAPWRRGARASRPPWPARSAARTTASGSRVSVSKKPRASASAAKAAIRSGGTVTSRGSVSSSSSTSSSSPAATPAAWRFSALTPSRNTPLRVATVLR